MPAQHSFTFKPGSPVERVLAIQPAARCTKHGNRYVVTLGTMQLGRGWSARQAWEDAAVNCKN